MTTTYHPAPHDFLPKTITNAANEVTEFTWDNRCQAITSTKDPNDKTTGQTYDNYCRPSRTTDPLDGYVQRLYQNLGTTSQRTRTETPPAPGASDVDWSEDYLIRFDWHKFKKGGRFLNRPHIDSKPLGWKHWPW